MALDRNALEKGILAAIEAAAKEKGVAPAQATLAKQIANAVHAYVGAAVVKGIKVDLTKGSPAPQLADGKLS